MKPLHLLTFALLAFLSLGQDLVTYYDNIVIKGQEEDPTPIRLHSFYFIEEVLYTLTK